MISTNPEYAPYDLPLREVREVWKFVHYIATEVPEFHETEQLQNQVKAVRVELEKILETLKLQ